METGVCKQSTALTLQKERKGEENKQGWCIWAGAPLMPREAVGAQPRGQTLAVGKKNLLGLQAEIYQNFLMRISAVTNCFMGNG